MKCFYHNDLDGRCAGAIVSHFTGNSNSEDFIEVDYNCVLPIDNIKRNEEVYFVDYSFTKERFTEFIVPLCNDIGAKVIWIDHHATSMPLKTIAVSMGITTLLSVRHSGAWLTWKYFQTLRENYQEFLVPFFVRLVDDYDRWMYNYPVTGCFKFGMDSVDHGALDEIWADFFNDLILFKEYKIEKGRSSISNIIKKGEIIKGYVDASNLAYRDSFAYESEFEGYKCLVVNQKTNSLIFGDKMDKYQICIVWAYDGKRYQYSLFSTDKSVNCAKLAEKYSGGGHPGAAGFTSDKLVVR